MPLNVEELITRYAEYGIAHWYSEAPDPIKQRARAALSNKIAQNSYEVGKTIKSVNGANRMFIPMPLVNHAGIRSCFFLPIRLEGGQNARFAFELFLLVDLENCLGFRFEPADHGGRAHAYGHVQINRRMLGGDLPVNDIPQWLPDSYPAFPICSSDSLQMFLSMTTSVHGYGSTYLGGMRGILRQVFESRPLYATECFEKMDGFLK